jgi:hypothetical protein
VAVDGAGNVYIADTYNGRVVEVSPSGAQITVGSGLAYPQGVAVDAAGNVFISDDGNGRVVEVQRSQAPTLRFAATTIGGTSGAQSVTIQNIGNAALAETGLTIGANFQQVLGSGTPADCTSTVSLAPGESCNLSISFVPQTFGNLQGSAVLTNNSVNSPQSISLSGTGILTTTTTANAANGQSGGPVTLSAVVGPSGASFSGTLQFQIAGANACSVSVTGSGTYSCSYLISQSPGTYTITANLTSTNSSVQGSSGNNSLTVVAAPSFTIKPLPPSETVTRGNVAGFLLELDSINGFKGNVKLRCSGGPSGSICVDLPQTVLVNGRAYALSGILFPKSTKPGTYIITFTGTSGSLTNSTHATFIVR